VNYATFPAGGNITITCTFTGSATFIELWAWAITGFTTGSAPLPFDSASAYQSAGPGVGTGIVTTNPTTLITTFSRFNSTANPTPGSTWTSIHVGTPATFSFGQYKIVSSAGTYPGDVTVGTGDQNGTVQDAVVGPAAAGGGGGGSLMLTGAGQ
jgi:hypothetical protein